MLRTNATERGPIVAFVNTKGGVGKTTSALQTAAGLIRLGRRVEVRDIDPSGQATAWAQTATKTGNPLAFPVLPANMRSVGQPADDPTTWVLIDTPPLQAEVIDAAVSAADIVILVTCPGALDLQRMLETSRVLGKPSSVLLTQTRPGTRATRDARRFLTGHHLARFDTEIPFREALRRAALTADTPAATGYGLVAAELIAALDPVDEANDHLQPPMDQ